jgi:riboflavin synthase
MFTGIIDHCGEIQSIESGLNCAKFCISSRFSGLQFGESIAIDGACLTVTDIKDGIFACELSPETLRLTVAQQYKQGKRVNLERALCVGDHLGGHFVSGHVDQTVIVAHVRAHAEFIEIHFSGVLPINQGYLIQKGSVAINGVSLTVNALLSDGFSVMLIPHTLNQTNLNDLQVGQSVNIEFDLMAKMVARQLQLQNEGKSTHDNTFIR